MATFDEASWYKQEPIDFVGRLDVILETARDEAGMVFNSSYQHVRAMDLAWGIGRETSISLARQHSKVAQQ